MSRLIIEIAMSNAAFEDPGEAERILAEIGAKITDGQTSGRARDVNGNTVGGWEIR